MQHREDVQGLRAIAISAVLLFHFFPEAFPNGFLGVDIFFVISGFLVASMLERMLSQSFSSRFSLIATFYYRRLKRLLPLHLAYCVAAIGLFTVFASQSMIEDSCNAASAALAFGTNIQSLLSEHDYFDQILDDNLFTHIWSLSVEVQFYAIAPFLLLFREKLPSSSRRLFLPFVGALSLLSSLYAPPLVAFNLPFARLWQFFAFATFPTIVNWKEERRSLLDEEEIEEESMHNHGGGKARQKNSWDLSRLLLTLYSLISFATLMTSFLPYEMPEAPARIMVTFSAAAIIAMHGESLVTRLLSTQVLTFIGDISYSLYLIHWPFSVYIVKDTKPLEQLRLATIPMSLGVTIAVFYLFERRYRQWTKTQIGSCCTALALLAVAAIHASPFLNEQLRQTGLPIESALAQNEYAFKHRRDTLIHKECTYRPWHDMNEPKHKGHILEPFGICEMPPGKGKLSFAVIGNSYAANQADLVWKYFKPFYSTFTMFSQCACEVLIRTHYVSCIYYANFTKVVEELQPDVTFIIQRYGESKRNSMQRPRDPTLAEMSRTLSSIEKRTKLVFVLDTIPDFNIARILHINDLIRKNMSGNYINEVTTANRGLRTGRLRTKKLAEECENCIFYDVVPALLGKDGKFAAYDEDTHLSFFDTIGHLTPWGRQKVEPVYEKLAITTAQRLRALETPLLASGQNELNSTDDLTTVPFL